jgi:transcription elongation factor GreA
MHRKDRPMAEPISASEALAHFVTSLEPEKVEAERPLVDKFISWFGADRMMSELSGADISRYLGEVTAEEEHAPGNLEPLRAFLAYSSRLAFTDENLVPYLLLEGDHGGARGLAGATEELGGRAFHVTREGLQGLESQLAELKAERPLIADKLREAMADKDFRENAPLDAARDEQAHLEAKIRETEDRLRNAVIIDADAKGGRANVGSVVKLLNIEHDREQEFTLVSEAEVDPSKGKISMQSPIGVALRNRGEGEEVIVEAPSGKIRFKVLEVRG